jgi:hypothetical protein
MRQAKQCLLSLIQQIPANCFFNIVSFGSKYSILWETPRRYTEDNIEEAKTHVEEMEANFGGTEILKPLEGKIINLTRLAKIGSYRI